MHWAKKPTEEQAFQKARHYCAYQERCHQEVRDKLYSFGLHAPEVDRVVSRLIEENYLNEERFACQFAGGHFRMKQWGRNRIKEALRHKRISVFCIQKALSSIDETEYREGLKKLAKKKWDHVSGKGTNRLVKLAKTTRYLIQKGYEPALIGEILREFS